MKYNIYELYGTDKNLEQDGVLIPVLNATVPDENQIKFKIKRLSQRNKAYQAEMARIEIKYMYENNDVGRYDEEAECFAKYLITGWVGVTDKDGKELPFNTKNAIQIMQDLPDVYERLLMASSNPEFFKSDIEVISKK